jgi:predicted neuraminidase
MQYKVLLKEHIFEPEKFFLQCHASTLVVLNHQKDEVLASWFGGTHERHPDVAIWLSRRKDGQWSDPVKVADAENIPCWNPVLFKGNNEKLYLFYKVGENPQLWHTMVMTSDDGGYTWLQPKELVEGDIGGRGPVKNKPIVLRDRTWVAPASIETETRWDCFVDISRDEGETWVKSKMVPIDHGKLKDKGIIQPTLWESEPGKVHMLTRSSEGFIYRSDSEDGGMTWCEAYPTTLPNNNSGIDLVKLENGNLVLVYNPVQGNWAKRTPIVLSLSEDNGLTWRDEFILDYNEAPESAHDGEFSYPAIVAAGNDVYITYTWKRKTIAFWKIRINF